MVLTEDYTYQLGDTGVLLNSSPVLPFVDIEEVEGLDSAPFRETQRDHEGQDGGFLDAEFEKGREIALTGKAYVDATNAEPFFDSLKQNYAPSTALVPFYVKHPGVSERFVNVKPRGVRYNITQARRYGETPIQFLLYAEDPRLYSNVVDGATIPFGTVSTIGIGFNLGFNLDFGGGAVPSSASLAVGGNRPTPVIFVVNGPCVDPVIRNVTTGDILRFSPLQLLGGETLTIDTQYRTVLFNGTSNYRGLLIDPNWFLLSPGIVEIGYGAATGTGSSLQVSYRSAWR